MFNDAPILETERSLAKSGPAGVSPPARTQQASPLTSVTEDDSFSFRVPTSSIPETEWSLVKSGPAGASPPARSDKLVH